MTKPSNQIVFFGSGPVAKQSLDFLERHFTIEAIITKPKPAGHYGEFPVADSLKNSDLPAYYPTNKAELSDLFRTTAFQSRVGIVVDYGIIINQDVIDRFKQGIINSHFSLLPQWRGADPITFAILSGQPITGVSLMLINAQLDEGSLLFQQSFTIIPTMTTPQLTAQLIDLSNHLLEELLPKYLTGKLQSYPQDITQEISYSRKLNKEDGRIDWSKPAVQLEREIRAFIEWPKSFTTLAGKEVILTKAHVVNQQGTPGELKKDAQRLVVFSGDQALEIAELKPAGKANMSARAFIAGYLK